MPLPNPLAPSWANSCLSNALPNTPTPLRLVNAFPTWRSFDLSSSLHQVNSWHPHSFLTWCILDLSSSSHQVDSRYLHSLPTRRHSTFTLLCQVYSWHLIGLATAVGQSPITYLPHSMCPSLTFLALYIYVSLLSVVRSSVTSLATLHSFSMSHPQFPVSAYPHFIYLYSISLSTLFSYSIHSLRPIPDRSDQPNPYHTRTCRLQRTKSLVAAHTAVRESWSAGIKTEQSQEEGDMPNREQQRDSCPSRATSVGFRQGIGHLPVSVTTTGNHFQ